MRRAYNMGSMRQLALAVVMQAGPAGARRADVRRVLHAGMKEVDAAIDVLRATGHLRRVDRGLYVHDDTCRPAPWHEASALLDLVLDCEAGVTLDALHLDTGIPRLRIGRVLNAQLGAGRLRQVQRRGLDALWQAVDDDALPAGTSHLRDHVPWLRQQEVERTPVTDLPAPAPGRADAVEASGDARFRLLDDKRFSIRVGTAELVLDQDATREMFEFLDELGGLRLQDQLPAVAPLAQGAAS